MGRLLTTELPSGCRGDERGGPVCVSKQINVGGPTATAFDMDQLAHQAHAMPVASRWQRAYELVEAASVLRTAVGADGSHRSRPFQLLDFGQEILQHFARLWAGALF
jgi:hypothetical protein